MQMGGYGLHTKAAQQQHRALLPDEDGLITPFASPLWDPLKCFFASALLKWKFSVLASPQFFSFPVSSHYNHPPPPPPHHSRLHHHRPAVVALHPTCHGATSSTTTANVSLHELQQQRQWTIRPDEKKKSVGVALILLHCEQWIFLSEGKIKI